MSAVLTGRRRRGFGRRAVALIAAVGVSAGVLVLQNSTANAYTLTGCRFSSATIPYLLTGAASGYNVTAARDDWTLTTDVNGWNLTTIAARADIRLAYYGATGWSGLTDGASTTCPTSKYHTKPVHVLVNRSVTDSFSVKKRQSVIAHEIGHALGLHHNKTSSPCTSVALMNGYDSQRYDNCGIYMTKTDDRTGVNTLY